MSDIRQESLDIAVQNKSKFYFCSDVDNFILEDTLESLVSLNLKVVAPLLRCVIPKRWEPSKWENPYYSNFHDDVDKEYWFKDTERYREILDYKLQGIFEVPLVHCSYLIRNDVFGYINYGEIPGNWEYKNFSISLSKAQIPQNIDARKTYGVLTLSNDIGSCEIALEDLSREAGTFLSNLNSKEVKSSEVDKKIIFDEIYRLEKWGFQSGSGSDPEVAKVWIDTVNQILGWPSIKSVLDIGCGDWRLGASYQMHGKDYLGMEVSQEALKICQKFESETVRFHQGDAELIDFPSADLILIKDVLQHLPTNSVLRIFDKIKESCRVALICNDYDSRNFDIESGGYRGLDLRGFPFNFPLGIIDIYGDRKKVINLFFNAEKIEPDLAANLSAIGNSRFIKENFSL
jgi:SAM-dependent methyltransferase